MADVRKCPKCGTLNPPEKKKCEKCSCRLEMVTTEEARSSEDNISSGSNCASATGSDVKRCPNPICRHANSLDRTYCVYCNSPLDLPGLCGDPGRKIRGPKKKGRQRFVLSFPWAQIEIEDELRLGRLPAFSCLADRLAVYGDISGKHAVIRVSELDVVIIDVGSSNGTFVNDRRVPEYQEIHIENDDTIRFANSLIVKVTTADE
jgi:hypothetical protein